VVLVGPASFVGGLSPTLIEELVRWQFQRRSTYFAGVRPRPSLQGRLMPSCRCSWTPRARAPVRITRHDGDRRKPSREPFKGF